MTSPFAYLAKKIFSLALKFNDFLMVDDDVKSSEAVLPYTRLPRCRLKSYPPGRIFLPTSHSHSSYHTHFSKQGIESLYFRDSLLSSRRSRSVLCWCFSGGANAKPSGQSLCLLALCPSHLLPDHSFSGSTHTYFGNSELELSSKITEIDFNFFVFILHQVFGEF